MPDKTLHGNGFHCPACELRQEEAHGIGGATGIKCQLCDGTGRVARSTQDIIADHVAEARLRYWPTKSYVEDGDCCA